MPDEGLSPERVIRALARPGLGDELHALGVRDVSGFGPAQVYIPPEHKSYIRERIDQAFGPETPVTEAVDEAGGDELDLGGSYSPVELAAGAKAYASGKRTIDEVKDAARISYRRARRLRSWLKEGAIFWDGRTVQVGRGYRLIKVDPDSGRSPVRLVQLYPA